MPNHLIKQWLGQWVTAFSHQMANLVTTDEAAAINHIHLMYDYHVAMSLKI